MPSVQAMYAYFQANEALVRRYIEAISAEGVGPTVEAAIEATPHILTSKLYTYSILLAMGAIPVPDTVQVQYVIDRLEE